MQTFYPLITYAALYNSSQEIGAGRYWVYDSGNGEWCSIDVVDGVFVVKDGSNNNITPSGGSLTVRDIDGTPSISATTLEFTNGTVTDQGSGIARVTISGGGGTPTAITVANEATDTTCFLTFVTAATGDLGPKTNAGLLYNSAANSLTCTTFVGALTGNASTVTTNANLTGHVTSVGNAAVLGSFTKAQLDAAVSDGNVLYVGDVTSNATHTGDATGATALTLATVNSNVGTFGSATQVSSVTVNAKGLVTAASQITVTPAVGSITGLGTNVATALAIAVGSAGGPVTFNGALGTPSSGTLTNCTALPPAGQTTAGRTQTICGFVADGGGSALSTQTLAAEFTVPVAMTLTAWSASCDTGTFTVKFWKIATGTALPTIANVINTSGVGISTGTAIRSTTLTDFTTTAFAAGDIVRCALTAVSGATWIKVQLEGTKN